MLARRTDKRSIKVCLQASLLTYNPLTKYVKVIFTFISRANCSAFFPEYCYYPIFLERQSCRNEARY